MSNDTVDDVDINEDSLYGHYRGTFNANTKEMKLLLSSVSVVTGGPPYVW